MRIISGAYRGRVLKSPSGVRTRPTSDRLRETLFNILQTKIDDSIRFLDLCAGTGAIGIEALSRGAGFAAFVDMSRRACGLIEENLDSLGVPEHQTEVVMSGAAEYLRRAADTESVWDIIFYDPPYDSDYYPVIYLIADEAVLLREDGLFVAEHHSKKELPDAVGELRRWRIVRQGETHLSFYSKA